MAARVIHFGRDDCYRVLVLRYLGYEVWESESLDALRTQLECDDAVDAVIISEELPHAIEQAAVIVRQHSVAPLILFCRSEDMLNKGPFDRVYSSFVPPALWVSETVVLIERGRAFRDDARLPCEPGNS
jgi:hypothetical protein